jgi:hypothetical protein
MDQEENIYDDTGEILRNFSFNNQNYLTTPLFGKGFLVCPC